MKILLILAKLLCAEVMYVPSQSKHVLRVWKDCWSDGAREPRSAGTTLSSASSLCSATSSVKSKKPGQTDSHSWVVCLCWFLCRYFSRPAYPTVVCAADQLTRWIWEFYFWWKTEWWSSAEPCRMPILIRGSNTSKSSHGSCDKDVLGLASDLPLSSPAL